MAHPTCTLRRTATWWAASQTGTIRNVEQQFTQYRPRQLVVSGGRLYSNLMGPNNANSDIAIWNDLSTISASHEPDVILHNLCGGQGNIRAISVSNDVLVATSVRDDKVDVCLYKNASSLATERQPDAIATDATLHGTQNGTDKAWLSKDGHLFVLDRDGIALFKDATAAPAFVTRLTMDPNVWAIDFLVLE